MKCLRCDNEDLMRFMDDTIDCCDCGTKLHYVHYLCSNCGMSWKTVNDNVVTKSDLQAMFVNLMEYMGNLENETRKADAIKEGTANMVDYIHKCIKCQSVSYEERPGTYRCLNPECEFEWEVLRFV